MEHEIGGMQLPRNLGRLQSMFHLKWQKRWETSCPGWRHRTGKSWHKCSWLLRCKAWTPACVHNSSVLGGKTCFPIHFSQVISETSHMYDSLVHTFLEIRTSNTWAEILESWLSTVQWSWHFKKLELSERSYAAAEIKISICILNTFFKMPKIPTDSDNQKNPKDVLSKSCCKWASIELAIV